MNNSILRHSKGIEILLDDLGTVPSSKTLFNNEKYTNTQVLEWGLRRGFKRGSYTEKGDLKVVLKGV